jgi:hypothetical protein
MPERVPTWGAAKREAAALSSMDETILYAIARLPLVPARLLLPLSGLESSASTAYRRLGAIARRGLLAVIEGAAGTFGGHRRLLLVTNLGLAVLAVRREIEPKVLAQHWGLHRAALNAITLELPMVLNSYELLALIASVRQGQPRVLAWRQSWRWAGPVGAVDQGKRMRSALPPAYARLEWQTASGQRFEAGYVLVPDTGGLSPRALRPQLSELARLLRTAGEVGPGVAIATTSQRRAEAWRSLLQDVASSRRGSHLEAQVATWCDWRAGGARLLLDDPARETRQGPAPMRGTERLPDWGSLPRPIDLSRVRGSVAAWNLREADRIALDVVGRHPYLPVATLGIVMGKSARWARERRASLVRRGLVRVVPVEELPPGTSAKDDLLEASMRGLEMLAGWLGLSLAAAVRHHGLAGGGPVTPVGPRGVLRGHLLHTLGADAVFAAIARAAGAQRGGALLEWRNAAASAHRRVRPDGYGLLRLGRRDYGFFVEFDRGTVRPPALRAKFAAYQRYGRSPRFVRDYDGFPTILVVTTGPGAERRIVGAIRATGAWPSQQPPILLTTVGWIENDRAGPFGPIWLRPGQAGRERWPL